MIDILNSEHDVDVKMYSRAIVVIRLGHKTYQVFSNKIYGVYFRWR